VTPRACGQDRLRVVTNHLGSLHCGDKPESEGIGDEPVPFVVAPWTLCRPEHPVVRMTRHAACGSLGHTVDKLIRMSHLQEAEPSADGFIPGPVIASGCEIASIDPCGCYISTNSCSHQ
jgi:hypothetical protein